MTTPPSGYEHSDGVGSAFVLLLDEIDEVITETTRSGQESLAQRDYDRAETLIDRARAVDSFGEAVRELHATWQRDFADEDEEPADVAAPPLTKAVHESPEPYAPEQDPVQEERIRRSRTHEGWLSEDAYYIPILRALIKSGGRARIGKVYRAVYIELKPYISEIDEQPYHDDRPREIRWKNYARFARERMVKDGLMLPKKQTGIWEISDAGRDWLSRMTGTQGE